MFEDGLCEISPGQYSQTFEISDINYQTARSEEKLNFFAQYCEILNALDPTQHLQITVKNSRLDYNEFRKSMFFQQPKIPDGYEAYREEFNGILNDKALEGQNSILREKFFTVSFPAEDYSSARSEGSRVEADFGSLFKRLGCNVHPLSGLERLGLLHNYLRHSDPFLFNYDELAYSGLTTKHAIAPMSLDFSAKRSFRIDDRYGQTLILRDIPSRMTDQLISKITDLPYELTVTLHIDRLEQSLALQYVQDQMGWMEMEQSGKEETAASKGYNARFAVSRGMRRQYNSASSLYKDLTDNGQRLFHVSMLIYTCADTEEQLATQASQISTICAQKSCTLSPLDDRQREGFNSILPLGKSHVDIYRSLTTESTAIWIPFTTQELYQPGGLYYGLNAMSHNMIFFNRAGLEAPNGWYLGKPGSGKSMASKREMIQVLLNDPKSEVVVIDPEGEYTALASALQGEVIRLSAGSPAHINPMDITEDYGQDDDPMMLKSEFVLSMMEMICGGKVGLTAGQRSIVSRVCNICYLPYFSARNHPKPPTLQDFYRILQEQPEPDAKSLALSLELYITGTLSAFAHETNVDTSKRFVVYNIKQLGKQLRSLGMMIVLDQIWNRISKNRARGVRTWFYIDEIQLLFSNEYCSNYFSELWSRARKWGAIPTGITQNVETLLLSDTARKMLSNSDFVCLLNQAQPDRIELAHLLNMSNQQLGFVTNTPPGNGMLCAGGAILPFTDTFPTDTKLYWLMTTKPDEQGQGQEE